MHRVLLVSLFVWIPAFLVGEEPPALDYYLPEGASYDPQVPVPSSVLGFEVGEWHVRHDQVVSYLRLLAEKSPRLLLREYGRTHEKRPLVLLVASSPENLARLDEIREVHVAAARSVEVGEDVEERPVVVWLGYSVHGNEPSGTNASLLVAYHLAAAQGPAVDALLANAVVLVDPAINPDGLSRFASWANIHRGKHPVADPRHREHVEGWPSGRTNHYWFDLNRDWLLLTHPESRGRLEMFHRWLPNLLGDFHEMGSGATYFFQPGVPTRQNPRTPERNLQLTRDIAVYHARALDRLGSLYYTEETFDDFYYGKGSTYIDINGGVGFLFEQASSRGQLQEGKHGVISFPFTIRNQFTTSLSMLEGALAKRQELLKYQAEFTSTALVEAEQDPVKAFVFGDAGDTARAFHLLDILRRHRIDVHRLAKPVEKEGRKFEPEGSYVVPLAQRQYRLVRSLFETRTTFEDTTFYDVSTWTLPLAFGVPHAALSAAELGEGTVGEALAELTVPAGRVTEVEMPYAWAFEWRGYYAPRAVYRLLKKGVRLAVATRPFEADVAGTARSFDRGTVVAPAGIQDVSPADLRAGMFEAAATDGIDVFALSSGLTQGGIDLGSPNMRALELPRPLLTVGRGVSTYEAGEVWHLLDHRFDIEVSLSEESSLRGADLGEYTHVILVDGSHSSLADSTWAEITDWVRRGGVLIATRGGAHAARRRVLDPETGREGKRPAETSPAVSRAAAAASGSAEKPPPVAYADFDAERNRRRISGAIFQVELDRTHPLGFGHAAAELPVFRRDTRLMELDPDPYANVARYTESPLLSGYASPENQERIAGTAAVIARRLGRGTVILLADNPNFRGFWYGTSKLFLNGLFFGGVIRDTSSDR
ncbi:MAG: M14 family metallopeptidase [Planctomycetota bacterium]|nr:M14 family metallopeptidase [Planctomycetota bacterium]